MRLLCALLLIACAASVQAAIQTREMPYRSADGTRMVGYLAAHPLPGRMARV